MQQNRLIALITALALSACGGNDVSLSLSGPGININTQHYGSRSPNRPGFTPNPNSQNNNRATPPAANWRRLNGMVATTARTDGDNIQRYFPDTSGCRDCAAIPSADRSSPYYLNGGNGTYRDTTPGGGQILYRNLSYASFGSYHASGDRYRHFHVLQPTPYAAVPTSGSAHYAGAVIYRDAEDGRIALDVDFASRAVGGSVDAARLRRVDAGGGLDDRGGSCSGTGRDADAVQDVVRRHQLTPGRGRARAARRASRGPRPRNHPRWTG